MNTNDILTSIETENANIEQIRGQLIQAKKIQLHSGIEGFDSPTAYGIYRHTGGKPLGVVGATYNPMDLEVYLDAIVQSCIDAGLDTSKLVYTEHKGGSKVMFELPLDKFELHTPMVGDVIETKLQFKTGFDGLTTSTLGFYAHRLWCANGCASWDADMALSFKNTLGNKSKIIGFADSIIQTVSKVENYAQQLGQLTKIAVTQAEIDEFFLKVTNTTVSADKEISTRKRNILDAINASVAIEIQNTGANWFSVLQGATRYSTHDMAKGDETAILFNAASKFNTKAHKLAFSVLN